MKPYRRKDKSWELKHGKWQPKLTEEHIVREIVTRLWWAKIKVWRIRERIPGMSKNLSTPGLPDLMGWIPGVYPSGVRPLFIEVKRPGGVRRPAQTYFIEEAKSDGCVAFFAESWRGCIDEFAKIGITLRED